MYYDQDTIVYQDGKFLNATQAAGNIYDQSLHYGYAVFEGIRSYQTEDGPKLFKAKEHFERMKFSCNAIGIPYPYNTTELIATCYELLRKNNLNDAYIRPLVSCGPNMSLTKGKNAQLLIIAWAWNAYLGNNLLRLATSSYRRISPASFHVEAKVSGHYVNSILAAQQAKDKGFDEALLLDLDGFIAEGPGANIFIEKDGILFTPSRGSILPGITRSTVLEICNTLGIVVIEKKITTEELYAADSAFYCGTAAEIIGIASVDQTIFRKSWDETIGAVIQDAYKIRVREKTYKQEKIA